MPRKRSIRRRLADQFPDEELIFWDDLDDAIIGTVSRCGEGPVVCYDYEKALECFIAQGMTYEGAVEWIEHNVVGAYVGTNTPFFLARPEPA